MSEADLCAAGAFNRDSSINRLKFMVMHKTKMASSSILDAGLWGLAAGYWSLAASRWQLVLWFVVPSAENVEGVG
jgi:hypothetical protein